MFQLYSSSWNCDTRLIRVWFLLVLKTEVRGAGFSSSKFICLCLRVILGFGCLNGILIMCEWVAYILEVALCLFMPCMRGTVGENWYSRLARIPATRSGLCLEHSPRQGAAFWATVVGWNPLAMALQSSRGHHKCKRPVNPILAYVSG